MAIEGFILISIIFLTITQLFIATAFLFALSRMFGVDFSLHLPRFGKQGEDEDTDTHVPLEGFKPDFTRPVTIQNEEDTITPFNE